MGVVGPPLGAMRRQAHWFSGRTGPAGSAIKMVMLRSKEGLE